MPSNHLTLCRPLLLLPSIFPSLRVFSNESPLHIRWPEYWSFSFSISPSNEHPGLISFRMDWLDLLAVQGTFKSLLQHHSSKAPILWCSAFVIRNIQIKTTKRYYCMHPPPRVNKYEKYQMFGKIQSNWKSHPLLTGVYLYNGFGNCLVLAKTYKPIHTMLSLLFSCPVMCYSLQLPGPSCQASLSLTISQSLTKSCHCISDAIQPSHVLFSFSIHTNWSRNSISEHKLN